MAPFFPTVSAPLSTALPPRLLERPLPLAPARHRQARMRATASSSTTTGRVVLAHGHASPSGHEHVAFAMSIVNCEPHLPVPLLPFLANILRHEDTSSGPAAGGLDWTGPSNFALDEPDGEVGEAGEAATAR